MTLTLCLLAAVPALGAAAPADSLWTLEEMVVRGDSLGVVTVHGSRVLVVPPAEIDRLSRTPGANVLDAAATLPGVTYRQAGLVSAGAAGNPPWSFRIRGIGGVPNDGLLVLVDGRPQQVGFWGHTLPDAHPLGVVERVEGKGLKAHPIAGAQRTAIGVTGNIGIVEPAAFEDLPGVLEVIQVSHPYKLVSREFQGEDTVFEVAGVRVGGPDLLVIAGPCSVESYDQTLRIGKAVKRAGAHMLRGGAFKP